MSDDYGDFPGVEISTSESDLTLGPSGHRYVHIDRFESHGEAGVELHLYSFDGDDQRDELIETMQNLRQDFILATGIIWPDELRTEVETADTFRMRALEWTYAVSGHMEIEADELPRIADQVEEYIEPIDG